MTYFAQEKRYGWGEFAIAAGVLALIASVLGYYELIDHRAIADGGFFGGLAHATLFASLTVYVLGVTPPRARPALICIVLALIAGGLEIFEIVPTAPGTALNWIFSLAGIGATWFATHLTGRPRRGTAIALAAILWGCGMICSLQTPADDARSVGIAHTAPTAG